VVLVSDTTPTPNERAAKAWRGLADKAHADVMTRQGEYDETLVKATAKAIHGECGFEECEGFRPVDVTRAHSILAAVLPLYRDRLLTELADEMEFGGDAWWSTAIGCADWLRSKVGGSSG
jgi:hypothetical protein